MKLHFRMAAATARIMFVAGSFCAVGAAAQEAPDDGLVIDAQPLASALQQYSEKTGLQVGYVSELAEGLETNGVESIKDRDEALETLLAGTGLEYRFINAETVVIHSGEIPMQEEQAPGKYQPAPSQSLMAQAQTPANQANATATATTESEVQDSVVDEVIVTGSRIPRVGYDTLQPATSVDSEFVDARGFTNIADALNDIPSFGPPGASPDTSRQSASNLGQNFVNIFGLGSQRTLVLLNGHRVVAGNAPANEGTASGLQVDLNILPTALIDRVEVIYTGGSPIYGNDAVAGTVNVITKKDFEGVELDTQYKITEEGDGEEYRLRATLGSDFAEGRGNTAFAVEYTVIEPLSNTARAGAFGGNSCSTRAAIFGFDGTAANDGLPNNGICMDGGNLWAAPSTGGPSPLNTNLGHPNAINPNGAPNEDSDGDGVPDQNNFMPSGAHAGTFINASGGANPGNFFVDENGNPFVFSLDGQGIVTYDEANLGIPHNAYFSQGAGNRNNPYVVDTGEVNQLKPDLKRWNLFNVSNFELGKNIRLVSEFLFSHSETIDNMDQPEWSSTLFGRSNPLAIKLGNPYLPGEARNLIAAQLPDGDGDGIADLNIDTDGDGVPDDTGFFMHRSNVDLAEFEGNGRNFRDQNTYRLFTGLEGEAEVLNRSWGWDTAFYVGQSDSVSRQGVMNQYRRSLALDAVVDPATGDIVCRATLDPLTDPRQGNIGAFPVSSDVSQCVPFNPFGLNNFSTEFGKYVYQDQMQESRTRQTVFEANAAGEILEIPGGQVYAAFGFAHRQERGEFNVDQGNEIDLPGRRNQAPSSAAGGFDTNEIYLEASLPVFGDDFTPLPGVEQFLLEGAIRFMDNDQVGREETWTAGGRMYLDVPGLGDGGLQLRGNVTQSVRAPSVLELFLPQSGGFSTIGDPCDPRNIQSGPNPSVRAANCQSQVSSLISAGLLDPDFVLADFTSQAITARTPTIVGGNPNLQHEVADSWTAGFVISPEFAPGLQASLDWTSIELNDAIVQVSGTQLGNACYDATSNFPNSEACSFIERDFNFQVIQMTTPFRNAAQQLFEGWVANVTWQFDAEKLPLIDPPGSFAIFGDFFYTDEASLTIGGEDLDKFADSRGGERGFEKLRYQLNLQYTHDVGLNLLWQTMYTSAGYFDINQPEENFITPKYNSFDVHNLSARYQLSENFGIQLVINNIFDSRDDFTQQAAVGRQGIFNDILGRRYTLGLRATF